MKYEDQNQDWRGYKGKIDWQRLKDFKAGFQAAGYVNWLQMVIKKYQLTELMM